MTGNRFRKIALPVLLSLGLPLLGLTAAGATVQDTPEESHNLDLVGACGLDLALVIDRSGSVQGNEDDVTGGVNAFLAELADTGSTVSLASFATDGSADMAAAPLTGGDDGNLDDFQDAVDDLQFENFTNWEAGLAVAQSQFSGFPEKETDVNRPDLLIIVTDGVPNRWIGGGSGSAFSQTAQNEAVGVANAIRDLGTHMFAIGIDPPGDGDLNEDSIQAISGPHEYSYPVSLFPFGEADWTKVSFENLGGVLHDIATDLCEQSVIVHKLVNGEDEGLAGFTFDATGQESDTTGETGTVSFTWNEDFAVDVTVSEDLQSRPGYRLDSIDCGDGVGERVGDGIEARTVGLEDTIECTFNNVTLNPGLSVTKSSPTTQAHEGDTVTYTIVVKNTGDVTLDGIVVSDDIVELGDLGNIGSLEPDEEATISVDYVIPAGQSADVVNTATACGHLPDDDVAVCEDDDHSLDVLHPGILIDKTASTTSITGSGNVTYSYTVTNTGDIDLFEWWSPTTSWPSASSAPSGTCPSARARPSPRNRSRSAPSACSRTSGRPRASTASAARSPTTTTQPSPSKRW